MVPFLACVALAVSLADHWSTWLCLHAPVPGWYVAEANPVAAWLFARVGLVPGLLLDSALTLVALTVLARARRVPEAAKLVLLAAVILWTGLAVQHNLESAYRLGLTPGGGYLGAETPSGASSASAAAKASSASMAAPSPPR